MNWDLGCLRAHLRSALRPGQPLPGSVAQARMAPQPRPGWDPQRTAPPGSPAAVLALFYPFGEQARPALLYTVRTDRVAAHRGQVSFPGGCLEAGESAEAAALREAYEEVAMRPEALEVIGRLTPLWIPATGFTVTPIVALAAERPAFVANPAEVERILEVPLAELLRPGSVREDVREAGEAWARVRYFDLNGAHLWGATAMMTAELLAVLGW